MEAERATQVEFLGHDGVDRQRHFPAQAELHDDAARSHRIEGAHERSRIAAGFEQHVETAFVDGEACEAVGLFGDVHHFIGTDLQRLAQRVRADIGRHDMSCTSAPRRNDRQRPDRAAASHQHALAEQRAGTAHGMQRHRQRLGHRAFAIAHRICQLVGLMRFDHDLLTECTLYVRRAHGAAVVAHVQAVVLQALLAELADAARTARADRHTFAGREAAHVGTDCLDHARHFVAEHHRLLDPHGTEAAVLVVVQVGTADAAAAHAHLQLIGAERRGFIGFDAQIAGSVNDECFHFFKSP